MQIIFIRHAEAVEASDFPGSDLDRPLTRYGWKSARQAFRRLPHLLVRPGLILHSAARRARETADALAEVYPDVPRREVRALNPGARPAVFRTLIRRQARRRGALVLIGHEPDLSEALADLTGGRCRLRKGAVAVVGDAEGYRLEALLEPDLLRAMKKPGPG